MRLDPVTFRVSGLLDACLELALATQNFLLLQLDLFLFLDDADLHFFCFYELVRLGALKIVSEFQLGLFLIHRSLVLGQTRISRSPAE